MRSRTLWFPLPPTQPPTQALPPTRSSPTLPQTPAVLRSLGATMGVVTAALAGWRPQGLGGGEGGEGNLSDWHVDRAAAVVERLVPGIGPFSAQQRWVYGCVGLQ